MTMQFIQSTGILNGSSGQVFFDNIPQTFSHLQLRVFARSAASVSNTQTAGMQLNLISTNSYNGHQLEGNGSAASAGGTSFYNAWFNQPQLPGASATANVFGIQIIDILDYSNTNKNKTIRAIGGFDANGSGFVGLYSGLFINTGAVSSITYNVSGQFLAAGSRADLYGITTSEVTGA